MTAPLIGLTTTRITDKSGRIRDALSPSYSNAVVQAGGIPVLVPLTLFETGNLDALHTVYKRLDGLIIPGGGDVHPEFYGEFVDDTIREVIRLRDEIEVQLIRWAYADDRPLLGICRGAQILNVALGGTLIHDIYTDHMGNALHHDQDDRALLAHDITINPTSHLSHLLGTTQFTVNSLHHQAVNKVASDLIVSAVASDGVVEGVEAPDKQFFLGVQWHPEEIFHLPEMRRLFEQFVRVCQKQTA